MTISGSAEPAQNPLCDLVSGYYKYILYLAALTCTEEKIPAYYWCAFIDRKYFLDPLGIVAGLGLVERVDGGGQLTALLSLFSTSSRAAFQWWTAEWTLSL